MTPLHGEEKPATQEGLRSLRLWYLTLAFMPRRGTPAPRMALCSRVPETPGLLKYFGELLHTNFLNLQSKMFLMFDIAYKKGALHKTAKT
jgi:hypothetical protein